MSVLPRYVYPTMTEEQAAVAREYIAYAVMAVEHRQAGAERLRGAREVAVSAIGAIGSACADHGEGLEDLG